MLDRNTYFLLKTYEIKHPDINFFSSSSVLTTRLETTDKQHYTIIIVMPKAEKS